MYNYYIIITEIKYDIHSQHRNLSYYFNKLMKQREEAAKSKNSPNILNPVTEQDAMDQLTENDFYEENDEYDDSAEKLIDEVNNIDTTTPSNKITSNKR